MCGPAGEESRTMPSETTAGPQGSQLGLGHEENRGAEEKKKGNWGISEFKAHWCHDKQKQKAPTHRSPRLGRSAGEGESLGRSGKGVPAHRLDGPSSSWGCCEHSPPDTACPSKSSCDATGTRLCGLSLLSSRITRYHVPSSTGMHFRQRSFEKW